MNSRSLGVFTLSLACVAFSALPVLAANADVAKIDDGRLHGFDGCLTQEASGIRYYDLTNAKADGRPIGTVRLTSTLFGVRPKDTLNHAVHVNGIYLGRLSTDPGSGHVGVKDVQVTGGQCS